MIDLVSKVIHNILLSLYQAFWSAVIFAVLFMFAYLYATEGPKTELGWKAACLSWWRHFKEEKKFRKIFYFAGYTSMILFRTVLCRSIWEHPLSDVIGCWSLIVIDSEGNRIINTEFIENIILFIPFIYLLLYINNQKEQKVIISSVKFAFLFSLTIESIQLFFKLGTFQLSDLFFNTLGGLIGGSLFYFIHKKHNGA